ncbi:indole-3-glycerol phosphate synthase TrpC [Zavarzinella formosa]|uniref:indole-3-glycerol phosphate synthase TrpC n=1 Tax=Zavarzinella formosa TaxID=360055 RepID=UPI0002E6E643|nr:indole-3-glycerol phosphate synthase TrpC [Zavarzinella formosa]
MTILDTIVARKRIEIETARSERPRQTLEGRLPEAPPIRDFTAALRQPGLRMIAEVKKASPSAGIIRADFDPVRIAQTYEQHGAACLSVLTDEHFFQGHLDYLTAIRRQAGIPVLRKEFILDEYQLIEARVAGADAVLLIAEILPGDELKTLHRQATALGLHVLVELHDADQLSRVIDSGAILVGINNRDLRTFKTTLDHTLDLLSAVPSGCVVISESGIKTNADMKKLEAAGVKAVLVGESLMRSPDIGAALEDLRGVLR